MALATALPFGLRSHHLAFLLFGFAQELGDSAGGRQVRRSGLIEALGRSVMGQGRSPWSSPPENIEWGPSFFSRTELLTGLGENPAHSGEQPVAQGRLQVRFSPPRPRGV